MSQCEESPAAKEADEELTISLPIGYTYNEFLEINENDINFCCNELKSDTEIQQWVKEFGEQNYVQWRIARTHPNVLGIKCKYRIDYRCQHSSTWYESRAQAKARKPKSVKCPSKLIIKRIQQSKYDFNGVCTVIYLRNQHNHDTGTAATLKYRDVSEKTKERLIKLFANGHSPSSAFQTVHAEALVEFGEEYESAAADRNKIPDLSFCYNLFYKVLKNDYGSLQEDEKVSCTENAEIEASNDSPNENLESVGGSSSDLHEDQIQQHDIDTVTKSLKTVFDDIVQRLQSGPSCDLLKASEMFCKNYHVICKGDNSLQAAMFKFGRRGRGVIPPSAKLARARRKPNWVETHTNLERCNKVLIKEEKILN